MKTQKIIRLLGLAILAFGSGCVAFNNGNLAHDVKPLPYKEKEEASITTTTDHVDDKKKITTHSKIVTRNGLEVNREIQLRKLEVAEKVGVARANGENRGFWERVFAPNPNHPYNYSDNNGSGGSHSNGSGTFTPYGSTSWR